MKYLALLLIILIGFVLRLIPAVKNGFWVDEVSTLFISRNTSPKGLILGADPPHNFLYYLLIKILSRFNTSILFLRAPSLIFSLINIFLVYKIAEVLKLNRFYGLICALLFVFSPFQIEYSWWARMYSMVLFFILFSFYSLICYFLSKKKIWLFWFVLSNVLGFYTDYSFFWYLLTLNFFAFIFLFKTDKKFFGSLLISDFIVSLYIPVFLKNFSRILDYHVAWIEKPNFEILKAAIFWYFGFGDYWNRNIGNIWFLPFILILILTIGVVFKDKKKPLFFLFILASFVLPLTLSFLASHILRSSIFLGWNLIVASLFPIFSIGLIISSFLKKKSSVLKILGIFVLSFVLYFNFNLYLKTTSGIHYDRKEGGFYQKAAELVKNETDFRDDILIFIPHSFKKNFDYYFNGYYKNQEKKLNYRTINYQTGSKILGAKTGNLWIIVVPWLDIKNPPEEFRNNPLWEHIKDKKPYKIPGIYRIKI